jgi:hypothetical protein
VALRAAARRPESKDQKAKDLSTWERYYQERSHIAAMPSTPSAPERVNNTIAMYYQNVVRYEDG